MEEIIKKIVDMLNEGNYTKEDIKELEKGELSRLAEPTVKKVVDLLAERRYSEIFEIVEMASWPVDPNTDEMSTWSVEDLQEAVDGFLELNELPYMDKFDVPCNFHPKYEYHQLNCILYTDGRGFAADYGLTTDGELNDLTLQMEFLFTDANTMRPVLLDVHVM